MKEKIVKHHNPTIVEGVSDEPSVNTPPVREVRKEIREYICASFMHLRQPENIADTDDLMESGILDSLAFTELIAELELRYGTAIRAIDLTHENFGSISAIADYVQRTRIV
jgi:acyl carrier protein